MQARVLDPEVVKYLPHLRTRQPSIPDVEGIIRRFREGTLKNNLFLLIQRADTGEVIGDGGLVLMDLEASTGELGVCLNSGDCRGKGYALEALVAMFDYAFEELGTKVVTLGTLRENKPMRTLLERKFKLIGRLAKREHGDNEDSYAYVVFKESWPRIREGVL